MNDILNDFSVSQKLKDDFRTASNWAKITAICNLVTAALALLAAMMKGTMFSAFISTAITVLLNIYLLNFGRKMGRALDSTSQDDFNDSLHDFQLYFKVLGILLIVGLVFAVLALLIAGSAIFSRL